MVPPGTFVSWLNKLCNYCFSYYFRLKFASNLSLRMRTQQAKGLPPDPPVQFWAKYEILKWNFDHHHGPDSGMSLVDAAWMWLWESSKIGPNLTHTYNLLFCSTTPLLPNMLIPSGPLQDALLRLSLYVSSFSRWIHLFLTVSFRYSKRKEVSVCDYTLFFYISDLLSSFLRPWLIGNTSVLEELENIQNFGHILKVSWMSIISPSSTGWTS